MKTIQFAYTGTPRNQFVPGVRNRVNYYFKKHGVTLFYIFFLLLAGCEKNDIRMAPGDLPPINAENDKGIGASAHDLLASEKYRSATLEIQYMPGSEPNAASISDLVDWLNLLTNKPGGIQVIQSQVGSAFQTSLSLSDIASIEKQYRTVYTSGSRIGVYFLFTDGAYEAGNNAGIAYRNTSMCFFGKTIHDNSGGIGQATKTTLETYILEHEFGHLLGLVNGGSAMQNNHLDAAHDKHCNNANCLMYYKVETAEITIPLTIGDIPKLDINCKEDLKMNGGK